MPRPRPLRSTVAAALALALVSCKSPAERESERVMPAVVALCATIPGVDAKEFVHASPGYADKLSALEATLRDELHPPPGTPAAAKLAPAIQWVEAARAEHAALEEAFRRELAAVEQEAHTDLTLAVLGGPTRPADEIAAALARSRVRVLVLWHGSGQARGFDDDHQNLPAARRAVDASERFIVGYVQRTEGEGVTFVQERVTAGQKVAFIALYEVPSKRRLGVFTVKGETARLPTPVPPPGTTLPGERPPLIESLLGDWCFSLTNLPAF